MEEGTVRVEVSDQGKGITPEQLAEIQSGRSGVGIRGMQERLRHFGGTITIQSESSGTCVIATLPAPKNIGSSDRESLQTVV